jgi:hypothetical protein
MPKFLSFILGNSRLTTIFGYILGAPGVYQAVQAFSAGQHVDLKVLVGSIALAGLGRFGAQEKPTVTEAK